MKHKLVCFDLDGTIIDETIFIWQTLHEKLGTSKEKRQKGIDKFHSGKISYQEWADLDVELWKEVGATKKEIMEAIRPLRLMEGALETLKELKKRGLKLAIISGSVDIALEYLMPNYREIFDDIFINKIKFDEKGNILGVEATPYDFKHKPAGLKAIAEREGFKLEECVFVGDHFNDIHAAEIAGLSIAFNCKSDELAQISDVVIKKKDLREILKYIE